MPNGFHGPVDEWERMESQLRQIDSRLAQFADAHGMNLRKNYHNWPNRWLLWSNGSIEKLVKISLADEKSMTYDLELCAWEDRDLSRYWKKETLLKHASWREIDERLVNLLLEAYRTVETWSAKDLEFAGKIGSSK
jgi:hypothetical protein